MNEHENEQEVSSDEAPQKKAEPLSSSADPEAWYEAKVEYEESVDKEIAEESLADQMANEEDVKEMADLIENLQETDPKPTFWSTWDATKAEPAPKPQPEYKKPEPEPEPEPDDKYFEEDEDYIGEEDEEEEEEVFEESPYPADPPYTKKKPAKFAKKMKKRHKQLHNRMRMTLDAGYKRLMKERWLQLHILRYLEYYFRRKIWGVFFNGTTWIASTKPIYYSEEKGSWQWPRNHIDLEIAGETFVITAAGIRISRPPADAEDIKFLWTPSAPRRWWKERRLSELAVTTAGSAA